jgi:hypothetical protein
MEEKEMKDFSWTAFFIVTGICFFAFSKVLLLLDGAHLPEFAWLGFLFLIIGTLNGIRVAGLRQSQDK